MKRTYYRVIVDYKSPYSDSFKIQEGETVQIGNRESEWPGWVWCKNKGGMERWIPRNYLDIQGNLGVMNQDYEATELNVSVGEELVIEKEESGWVWVTNKRGEKGWVPMENVTTR